MYNDEIIEKSLLNADEKVSNRVYNPIENQQWLWHFHLDDRRYLSDKKRICGLSKAAEFTSNEDARVFLHE